MHDWHVPDDKEPCKYVIGQVKHDSKPSIFWVYKCWIGSVCNHLWIGELDGFYISIELEKWYGNRYIELLNRIAMDLL